MSSGWLRSQAAVPGDEKDLTLFGRLSSFCHLSSSSNDKKLEPRRSGQQTWFSLSKSEATEQRPAERTPNNQISFIRKMCGEFREATHVKNKEEREERTRELEKIRGARWEVEMYIVYSKYCVQVIFPNN